uniref:Nucleolar protein 16 n=1 Tax=Heterorhabditis bacteriophora TaxID=37862 RepID=A0A1I7XL06_HETBA
MSIDPSYGLASYVMGRHRKNKVFIWQSRTLKGRVYEFILASRFKVPGLISWKCMHCMQLKDQWKKDGKIIKNLKIPLVLIDNDIIKENPDRPLNAPHFCQGKDAVEAVLQRSKLQFYEQNAGTSGTTQDVVNQFTENVLESVPFNLNATQKRQIKRSLDEKCEKVMKKVLQKRRKESCHQDGEIEEEYRHGEYAMELQEISHALPQNSDADLDRDEDEFVDVEGDDPIPKKDPPQHLVTIHSIPNIL